MKTKICNLGFSLLISFSLFAQTPLPGGVKGASLWLKAETTNNVVSLRDVAGGTNTLRNFRMAEVNHNPAAVIGKDAPSLASISLGSAQELSFFAVFALTDSTQEQILLSLSRKDSIYQALTDRNLADLQGYNYLNIQQEKKNLPKIYYYTQNKHFGTANTEQYLLQIARKAADKRVPAQNFQGTMGEVLLFDRTLKYNEVQRVQSYLAIKFGIGLQQKNLPLSYLASDGSVIWDAEQNFQYPQRITGIGSDATSGLYQPISGNVEAETLRSIGIANEAQLGDKDFMLWGDDGGELRLKTDKGLPQLLMRRWLAQFSGKMTEHTFDLSMNVLQIEGDVSAGELFYLSIDKSGSGEFPVGMTDFYKANERKGQDILFRNISFGKTPTAVFGLMKAPDFFVHYQTIEPYCGKVNSGKIRIEAVGGIAPYTFRLEKDGNNVATLTTNEKNTEFTELSTGHYRLTAKEASGKVYQADFSLSHKDMPTAKLADNYLIANGHIPEINVLSAADTDDYSYVWRLNGKTVSFDRVLYPEEAGIYDVEIRNSNDCVSYAQTEVLKADTRKGNIKEMQVLPTLSPTGEYVVRLSLYEPAAVNLRVFDMKGLLVQQFELGELSDFHVFEGRIPYKGVFVIEAQAGESRKEGKIVVP